MKSIFQLTTVLTLACFITFFTACDSSSGGSGGAGSNGGGGSQSVISLAGISTTESAVSFTWKDPDISGFDHLAVSWTDGSNSGNSGDIAAGTLSYDTSSAGSLSAGTSYTFIVQTLDSSGLVLDETIFFAKTSASGQSAAFTTISTAEELYNVRNDLTGSYLVIANIDLSGYSSWTPIGDYASNTTYNFSGIFNGNGHTISNLTISTSSDYQGLFGKSGGKISGTGIINTNISANDYAGSLAAYNYFGTISNCYASGSIESTNYSGGLVGYNYHSTVSKCYASVSVDSSGNSAGGLVGYNTGSTIENCYASGSVKGQSSWIGGLVGQNGNSSTIKNCYSTGSVKGDYNYIGGLVGFNSSSTIENCYATGLVEGPSKIGGLAGANYSTITGCFYDSQTTGYDSSTWTNAGTPLSTADMQTKTTFTNAGWDFTDIWGINGGYPYLKAF